eukprot:TRINITY_DN33486_c0_g1_i1.p1 TRINITY_DN33486_c0_g1~~TRINITY_DN33486_c0_g1_i1.p1  ORF type:complete len:135 (+),score=23.97 TRINITY_DN33486_c0_g1_i1:52-456(+)
MSSFIRLLDAVVYYSSDIVGFGYPALKTFETLQTSEDEKSMSKQWLQYWVIFALLYSLEFFLAPLLRIFLLGQYHYVKFVIIIYLNTGGAQLIYEKHLIPLIKQHAPDLLKGSSGIASTVGRGIEKMNEMKKAN